MIRFLPGLKTRPTSLLALAFVLLSWVGAAAQERTMVVFLPSTPNESATRVAAAVTQLASYLSERSGLRIEAKAFRRAEDATAYLASSGNEAALIVSDQAFLLDLPQGFDVSPSFRFVRAGRETGRKIVVVRSNDRATSLAGLRGRALAIAGGAGRGSSAYLSRVIFGGEIDAQQWFSRLTSEPDDFTAATNVMFGRIDAALVSDDNPVVVSNLGKGLREVYSSRPVSLPVVAIRSSLSEAQRTALEQALAALPRAADNQTILAGLGIERLQRVPDGSALLRLPSAAGARALEIAMPNVSIDAPRLPPLSPDQLPYFLGVDLLDLPIPLPPIEPGGRGGTGGSGSQ